EGQGQIMGRFAFGAPLAPFHATDAFAADHVGPGTGHGDLNLSTVEVDQHFALRSLTAGPEIKIDQLLIVALHEVNFDSLDAPFLELVKRLVKLVVERLPHYPKNEADILLLR